MSDEKELKPNVSYYFNADFNDDSVKEVINFFNGWGGLDPDTEIDFYLNSPGGLLPAYSVLKNILERSPFVINLINAGEVSSYAFILFYSCRNVNKVLLDNTTGLIHTVSSTFEDRELRKNDNFTRMKKLHLDRCNLDLLELIKENKILPTAAIRKLEKGEDIILLHKDLHKIMLHCPFGNYIY